jgi:hypothetical protein
MRVTLTDSYVLVETDDIDFNSLRKVVEKYKIANSNVIIEVTDYKKE